MKINQLIKLMKLSNWDKYLSFVKAYDTEKWLNNEPLVIKDKTFGNKDLKPTTFQNILGFTPMHKELAEKYSLNDIASGKTDFERALNVLNWLTENTFYNGAQFKSITDNSLDILEFSFKKPFKNALNCRLKAITFADCLVSVGIKAYPVCMVSQNFSNCHFNCHVYISELDKWCAFDPSFGCYFTDESKNPISLFEMREIFLDGKAPVVNGYNFNGTDECIDIYVNGFEKFNLSNLSTWQDNSMERRTQKKIDNKKKFQSKIPD